MQIWLEIYITPAPAGSSWSCLKKNVIRIIHDKMNIRLQKRLRLNLDRYESSLFELKQITFLMTCASYT